MHSLSLIAALACTTPNVANANEHEKLKVDQFDLRDKVKDLCEGPPMQPTTSNLVIKEHIFGSYAEDEASQDIRESLRLSELPPLEPSELIYTGSMGNQPTYVFYCELNRNDIQRSTHGGYTDIGGHHSLVFLPEYIETYDECVVSFEEDPNCQAIGDESLRCLQDTPTCEQFLCVQKHERTHAIQKADHNRNGGRLAPRWIREWEADKIGKCERNELDVYMIYVKWIDFLKEQLKRQGVKDPETFINRRIHISAHLLERAPFEKKHLRYFSKSWYISLLEGSTLSEEDILYVSHILAQDRMANDLWLKTQTLIETSDNPDYWESKIFSAENLELVITSTTHGPSIYQDDYFARQRTGDVHRSSSYKDPLTIEMEAKRIDPKLLPKSFLLSASLWLGLIALGSLFAGIKELIKKRAFEKRKQAYLDQLSKLHRDDPFF